MVKRSRTMRNRKRTCRKRTRGGFRLSFERDPVEKTLNPFTWFRSSSPVETAQLEEVVVDPMTSPEKPAPLPPQPNTVLEMGPVPNTVRVMGEANAAGIPPTPGPEEAKATGFKTEGGRRRRRGSKRTTRKRSMTRRRKGNRKSNRRH